VATASGLEPEVRLSTFKLLFITTPTTPWPQFPEIAIIGAGPAGLTLARLLHVSDMRVDLTLYERDASRTPRLDQGGTLDLHTDPGLAAIRRCGLWDSFRKYARYDGQEFIVADKNATELVHMRGVAGPFDCPKIGRQRLKEILLDSVPEECVRWGRYMREVTEEGTLRFDRRKEMEGAV
jgi:2-polyprenyl-6-methoxyphenol hydroxylase-like FAD-dependent oxidoreductase